MKSTFSRPKAAKSRQSGQLRNYGAIPLPLTEETLERTAEDLPIALSDGEVRVRWRAGASLQGAPTLQSYLRDRVALLVNGVD